MAAHHEQPEASQLVALRPALQQPVHHCGAGWEGHAGHTSCACGCAWATCRREGGRREGGVTAQTPHAHSGLKEVVVALCLHVKQAIRRPGSVQSLTGTPHEATWLDAAVSASLQPARARVLASAHPKSGSKAFGDYLQ